MVDKTDNQLKEECRRLYLQAEDTLIDLINDCFEKARIGFIDKQKVKEELNNLIKMLQLNKSQELINNIKNIIIKLGLEEK